jgi:hypothetical protein
VKDQLRKLDVLLRKIQNDHNEYRSDPYWKSEFVSNSDPEYGGLDNETAMREREANFHTLSKDARKQLGLMEQLTAVSPDNLHYGPRLSHNDATPCACTPRVCDFDSASDGLDCRSMRRITSSRILPHRDHRLALRSRCVVTRPPR